MAKPAPPMSRIEWLIDAELRGHTPDETIRYLADCADFEDEQARRRALPANVILAGGFEPRWLTKLRSWFGR
jgi:hypothetical protein